MHLPIFLLETCLLYTSVFDEDGNLDFRTSCKENDFFYDEIGSVLKIKQYRNERRELLESIDVYKRQALNRL